MSKKQTFYEEMFYLAHENGVAYKSEYYDTSFTATAMKLTIGPLGPKETKIMVDKSYGDTNRLRHSAWATNKDEPGHWRPLTLKMAKYILEQLIKDASK